MSLIIANKTFNSRLFTGTGKFASRQQMKDAFFAGGSEMVTMAMKRVDLVNHSDDILPPLLELGVHLLPNTAGAHTVEEDPDPKYLLPDPIETLRAAEILVKEGFIVLPYCSADPLLCKRLEEVGCAAVMPLGAPIGTNKGLVTDDFLQIIIEQSNIPVIVDAGIGAPSHAAYAMELGADAVLVNTAIATARDPIAMAHAFKLAVQAGRQAYLAGLPSKSQYAQATSPLTNFSQQ